MNRSLISCLTLTGAMLLSTAAFSQTMIDGKEVSAADLPKVQAACDALTAKGAASTSTDANKTASTDANANQSTTAANSSSSGDAAAKTNADANTANTGGFDVSTLTLDQCKTAGLIKTP